MSSWQPVSDSKFRVGIVGYGLSRFGAAFGFQNHPNVVIIAVSDLIPECCQALAQAVRCAKTFPSLEEEEMVKDDRIEAIFAAIAAPGHARHCIESGKHVMCTVPATFASKDANRYGNPFSDEVALFEKEDEGMDSVHPASLRHGSDHFKRFDHQWPFQRLPPVLL